MNTWVLMLLLLTVLTQAYHGLAFCPGGPALASCVSGIYSTTAESPRRTMKWQYRSPACFPAGFGTATQGPGAATSCGEQSTRRMSSSLLYMAAQEEDSGEVEPITIDYVDVDRPSRRWEGTQRLPRINHIAYFKTLKKYAAEDPVDNTLLVWGRKSVGKTRTMQRAIAEWRAEGRMVVEIDLKGVQIDLEKLPAMLWTEFFKEDQRVGGDVNNALKETIPFMLDWANMLKNKKTKAALEKVTCSVSLATDTVEQAVGLGDSSAVAEAAAGGILKVLGNAPGVTPYTKLVEELERRAQKKGNKPPVLVIREVQKLVTPEDGMETGKGQAVFDALFSAFEKHKKQGTSRLPVIVESSEYLWSNLQAYVKSSPQSFQAEEVTLWSKEEARRELVRATERIGTGGSKRIEFFTDREFEQLWDAVGGHAGEIFDVHSRLRKGKTLEEALEAKRSATAGMLTSILRAPQGEDFTTFLAVESANRFQARLAAEDCRRGVLEKLRGSPLRLLRSDVREQIDACSLDYLLQSNVLWEDEEGEIIAPMHRGYELAIKAKQGRVEPRHTAEEGAEWVEEVEQQPMKEEEQEGGGGGGGGGVEIPGGREVIYEVPIGKQQEPFGMGSTIPLA